MGNDTGLYHRNRAILRERTWFTEGHTEGSFRNSGTLGDGWLQRYGAWVVVSVRFLYGFRIAGPVLIGASGMAWTRFAAFYAVGAVLWAVLLTGLGWFFGQAAQALLGKAQHYEGWLALGVIVVALGYALWSRRRARRGAGPGQGR